MEAILWESGARGIDELEELRIEQEEAVTKRKAGQKAESVATPFDETMIEDFRAWRKDPALGEPVYQIGIDIPGLKGPRQR